MEDYRDGHCDGGVYMTYFGSRKDKTQNSNVPLFEVMVVAMEGMMLELVGTPYPQCSRETNQEVWRMD